MRNKTQEISKAIDILDANLSKLALVAEWSDIMGYNNPQKFTYKFVRYFKIRPLKVLDYIRLKSIICYLKSEKNYSNFEIALAHSLPDEKALNGFTNYHLGCPPTQIKTMPESQLEEKFKKFGNKIQEQIQGVRVSQEFI